MDRDDIGGLAMHRGVKELPHIGHRLASFSRLILIVPCTGAVEVV